MHGDDGFAGSGAARDPCGAVERRLVGKCMLAGMEEGLPLRQWPGQHFLELGFVRDDVKLRSACCCFESGFEIVFGDRSRFEIAGDPSKISSTEELPLSSMSASAWPGGRKLSSPLRWSSSVMSRKAGRSSSSTPS